MMQQFKREQRDLFGKLPVATITLKLFVSNGRLTGGFSILGEDPDDTWIFAGAYGVPNPASNDHVLRAAASETLAMLKEASSDA
jgi:hypothetical protein